MEREIIEKTITYIINQKCTVQQIKQRLSKYSQQEKSASLKQLLNSSEFDYYNYLLKQKSDLEQTISEGDDLSDYWNESLQRVADKLYQYEKRIIDKKDNLPKNKPTKVDVSKFKQEEQMSSDEFEIDEETNARIPTKELGELELNQINLQNNIEFDSGEYFNLSMYFDEYSAEINGYLWNTPIKKRNDSELNEAIKSIDSAIAKTDGLMQDTRLYHRGIFDVGLNPGDVTNLKGYTSTSFQKEFVQMNNQGNVYTYTILAPMGTKGVCADGGGLSFYREYEYLLGRDTQIEILSVDANSHEVVAIIKP